MNVESELGKTFNDPRWNGVPLCTWALESNLLLIGGPLIPVHQIFQQTAEALSIGIATANRII